MYNNNNFNLTCRLAQTGEGVKECELVRWFVKEGEPVEEFDKVCEVQSDKATIEITSPYKGSVQKLRHNAGDVVQVGDVLAEILAQEPDGGIGLEDIEESAYNPQGAPVQMEHREKVSKVYDRGIATSPAVRHLAKELGIDLSLIAGTGPQGRITKSDVLNFVEKKDDVGEETTPKFDSTKSGSQPLPATASTENYDIVPLRGFRKAMVRTMTAAGEVPHFYFCDEINMNFLKDIRSRLRGGSGLSPTEKLTYMPFFIKAASVALRSFPSLNSSMHPSGDAILQHKMCNIGVAIATEHGLVVPNIKDVDSHSIVTLANELLRLQKAAKANKLSPADLSGTTFTLTNIGSIGGTYALPLINPPEVAIMAFGRTTILPRYASMGEDDNYSQPMPVNVMNICLGADHRVVDGATLAGFATHWKSLIEDPARLLLYLH